MISVITLQLQALAFGGNYKKNKKKAAKPQDPPEKEVPKAKPNSQGNLRVDEDWQRRDNEVSAIYICVTVFGQMF